MDNVPEVTTRTLWKHVCGVLDFACNRRMEATGGFYLEPRVPNFTLAAELGHMDCGLVHDPRDQLRHKDGVDRLPAIVGTFHPGGHNILGLDFKFVGVKVDRRPRRDGFYGFQFGASYFQRGVAAFIVQNVSEPDLVALIPHWYLDRTWPSNLEDKKWSNGFSFSSRPIPLLGADYEPFAREWNIWAMEYHFLDKAIKNLYKSFRDCVPYVNPRNNIPLSCGPRAPLQRVDALLPAARVNTDFYFINDLREALARADCRYSIQRNTTRLTGDCVIEGPNNTKVVAEIKRSSWKRSNNGQILHSRGYEPGTAPTLTFLTEWDFLITTREGSNNKEMLIIPKKVIPAECFNLRPLETQHITWPLSNAMINKYLVQWGSDQTLKRRLEQILDDYYAAGANQPPRVIPPPANLNLQTFKLVYGKDCIQDEPAPPPDRTRDVSRATKGKQRNSRYGGTDNSWRWPRHAWEDAQAEWLRLECQKAEYGFVFGNGIHPSGQYVFVPGWHKHATLRRFVRLSWRTPMIFLNFATMGDINRKVPTDKRRDLMYLHATHGITPCLYILSAMTSATENVPHGRYLVPGSAINTPLRSAWNEGKSKIAKHAPKYLWLSNNEVIDTYAMEEGDIVRKLREMFEGPAEFHKHRVYIGDQETKTGREIDPDDYIVNQREVLLQYIPLQLRQTPFLKVGEVYV